MLRFAYVVNNKIKIWLKFNTFLEFKLFNSTVPVLNQYWVRVTATYRNDKKWHKLDIIAVQI